MYKVLDLFSGIGGFSLGLERTGGFRAVAFCEIEPFPQKVLRKHWPEVPIYDDVRTLTAERLRADGIDVDVICGGFPCQDISLAGKGAGLDGERSGLWSEIARLAGELRPRYVIVENVAALLNRGLDRVLSDLAAIGLDAEWHCIPAAAVGAPHRRDRFWLVAYAAGLGRGQVGRYIADHLQAHRTGPRDWLGDAGQNVADAENDRSGRGQQFPEGSEGAGDVADAEGQRQQESGELQSLRAEERLGWSGSPLADTDRPGLALGEGIASDHGEERQAAVGDGWWLSQSRMGGMVDGISSEFHEVGLIWEREPDTPRVAHGVKSRVDRLKALGNSVVPQIPELIGRAILASEHA